MQRQPGALGVLSAGIRAWIAFVFVPAVILAAVLKGWQAAAGLTLGLVATGFGIVVWWLVIRLLGRWAAQDVKPALGTYLVILAFFCKIPIFGAAVFLDFRLGGAARPCFLVGMGLVYFALVERAVVSNARSA